MRNGQSTERFAQLSEEILRAIWEYNPAGATIMGIHDYDDTLGDMSPRAFMHYADTFRRCLRSLQTDVDPTELGMEDQLDYHVALSLASTNLILLDSQRPWANNPSIFPQLCVWGTFSLLVRNFAPFEERMSMVLSRLREIPDVLEASKVGLDNPAPIFIQVALEMIKGAVAFYEGPFIECANRAPSLTIDLMMARNAAVEALNNYSRWLTDEMLPNAHGDFAVGEYIYQQLLYESHYLTYTPEDLVKLAKTVLDESQAQIAEVAARIDPSVTWEQLVERLKQEHPPKEGLTAAYGAAFELAKQFVIDNDLVTFARGEELKIGETPSFERSVLPYAAYMPPAPFEASRTGCLWVTPIDETAPPEVQQAQLLEHCIYSIPIIALHEGYPGHHLQLTRAMDVSSPLRRQALNDVLCEGWALYCEQLMEEQGFYTDPRVQVFQLKDAIWRACRVMIDVGLHTGGLSFEDAVHMLMDTARMEKAMAVAEVKRYTGSPTQPMAYVIGRMLLLDLRQRMMRSMRTAFDLKRFHDEVLSFGSVPLPLISARMMAQSLPEIKGRFRECAGRESVYRSHG